MPRPTLALSSCWCSHRFADGYAMCREMAALGFRDIELSHGIRITLVEGILRAVSEGVVRVPSCHNFCPLPAGITTAAPNLYVPSSTDPRERAQWVRHTRRSIEFAAQCGAKRLVLHLGRCEFFWFNPVDGVKKAARGRTPEELAADASFQRKLARSRARIEEQAVERWAHTLASLAEVAPLAVEKGVTLLAENRERLDELPLDDALPDCLVGVEGLRYWHDTGHATIKQGLGVVDHAALLRRTAGQLDGFHVHDVDENGRDHQPLGTGRVAWDVVEAALEPHHLVVVELSPRVTPDDVASSRMFAEAMLTRRFGPAA